MLESIQKRDGLIDDYNKSKISHAIFAAAQSVGGSDKIIADHLADKVDEYIKAKYNGNLTVDDVQNAVERILIKEGYADTAKAYILYRNQRDRVRDSNSQLMSTIRDLTLEDASTMDLKRENANIDGNSTMGTMLRYGSEASKRFVHLNLLRPEHSKAHLSGLIHIHDLDFYPLTINCITKDSAITIIDHLGNIQDVTISYFDDLFLQKQKTAIHLSKFDFKIRSRDGFTKIVNVMRRPIGEKETIYKIHLEGNTRILNVSGNHLLPVVRNENYNEILIKAKNIVIGDRLPLFTENGFIYNKIIDIETITDYKDFVYDIETENHYFVVDNILVHNCVQIDITKLFKNGFSTGHGKLREPSDIRSASSLISIAIQSSQNDMFKYN